MITNSSAGFMLARTVLAPADFQSVTDPREDVAAGITALEDAPAYALVVTGPMQVIVPIFAETTSEIQEIVERIMGDEGIVANMIVEETRVVSVAAFYQNGETIDGLPQSQKTDTEIELRDRSIAYVFVKTATDKAHEVAAYASNHALMIPAYNRKADLIPLTYTDANNELIGVRWAAVMEEEDSNGNPTGFQVLIHLRTFDNDHLGRALAAIRRAPYVSNDVAVQSSAFSGGDKTDRVKNGPP